MSETKLISPLLDGFVMGGAMSNHDGVACYPAMRENSDNKYIVKSISIPASQNQLDALLLTGAFKDAASATEYFKELAEGVTAEAEKLQELSKLEGFLPFEGWQIAPMENNQLGYQVYLVGSYKRSLEKYMRRNPMTYLGAVNLGLDICAALEVCRKVGLLYVDLKPSNIYISEEKRYRIGDLGFVNLDSLKYASLPSKYRSCYSAPEMHDALATVNTTVDTYSLGLILYQIYNDGNLPFAEKAPAEALPAPANADYEMAEIILKACDPDPAKRWQDPVEMGQAIAEYMQRNNVNDVPILPPVVENAADADQSDVLANSEPAAAAADETVPSDENAEEIAGSVVSEEVNSMLTEADDLLAHTAPEGVVAPETAANADTEDGFHVDFADEDADSDEFPDEGDDEDEEEDVQPVRLPVRVPRRTEPEEEDEDEDDEEDEEESERKPRSKAWIAVVSIILVIGLLCAGAYYYYNNYYLLPVESITASGSEDKMTVTVVADIDESLLTVVCTDTYGNTKQGKLSGGIAEFENLTPGTTYKIQLQIEGFHKLTNNTTCSYSTPKQTNIVSFTAGTGTEDGSVVLNFTVDGSEPSQDWQIAYVAEGEEEKTVSFTGHTVTVNGLTVGKTYNFRLVPTQELFLTGTDTIAFTASQLVLAEDLQVVSSNEGTLVVEWATPEGAAVSGWKIRCYSDDGYDNTITVQENTASFTGIDNSKAYTVEVTADGMMQGTRTYITANPITITNIQQDTTAGLTLTWEYSGIAPSDGWLVLYSMNGSEKQEVIKTKEANATLTTAIPGVQYDIIIQAADGATVFGGTTSYTCPEAAEFAHEDYMISAQFMSSKLCKAPEEENWNYHDVATDGYTDTFAIGQKIGVVVRSDIAFYPNKPGDITAMYVIRTAEGEVICVNSQTLVWADLWAEYKPAYCDFTVPSSPNTAGSYILDVYLDGGILASLPFTVTE